VHLGRVDFSEPATPYAGFILKRLRGIAAGRWPTQHGCRGRVLGYLVVLAVAALVVVMPKRALAHPAGLSQGSYSWERGVFTASIIVPLADFAWVAPALDTNRDGRISPSELLEGAAIEVSSSSSSVEMLAVSADGSRCPGRLSNSLARDDDGVQVQLRYTCQESALQLKIEFPMLQKLPREHRHLASFRIRETFTQQMVSGASPLVILRVANGTGDGRLPGQAEHYPLASIIGIGIRHIVSGYDHAAFLLGLVLIFGRFRSLFFVVTAFTVGHTMALLLTALTAWRPDPLWVEPAIALSVVYLALENIVLIRRRELPHGRWRLTLPFGLLHGLGFSSELRNIQVEEHSLLRVLAGFNVGVEVGQLGLLVFFACVLHICRRQPLFARRGSFALSMLLAAAGAYWFAKRIAAA
jgi:HupE / UreJ protein